MEHEKYLDLVFEGGGLKGIGLVGALAVLQERGYQPQNIAGTSAGAIVATLLAAGYTASELHQLLLGLDFTRFLDPVWEERIPLAGTPMSLLTHEGLYQGEAFRTWLADLLAAKGVHTFRDLRRPDGDADEPRYRYQVQVIASDLTGRCLLVLPQDATKLGLPADDLNVAFAVRMSMSIPFFFCPVQVPVPPTGQDHLIVDGGLLSNFPVWLFDSTGVPAWPTFGLKLVEPDPHTTLGERLPPPEAEHRGIAALVDYGKSLIQTMLEAHDRLYIERANFARTIPIPTLGVRTTEFSLSPERAEALYQAGRTAAEDFLATWNFADYIAAFRGGPVPSRAVEVAAEMLHAASSVLLSAGIT